MFSWTNLGAFQSILFSSVNNGEPKHAYFSTSPTLMNHETPLISEEEFIAPFVLHHPPMPIPMRVPLSNSNKFGKYENHIPHPCSDSSSIFHDSDSIQEIPEWLMKAMVKTNFSILQDGVIINISSLKYDLDSCNPLKSTCHDSYYCDPPNQFTPPASFSHYLFLSCCFKL